MRPVFILVFFLHSFLPAQSQNINPIGRSMDSISQQMEVIKKRMQEIKDSMHRRQVQTMLDQQGKSLDQFLEERREAEKKQRRQMYVRIGIGVLFLAVLIIGLTRRRKTRTENR